MLQITLDSNESNKSQESKKNKNWGFKVKLIKDNDSSEMILSFEEEISTQNDKEKKSNLSIENKLEQLT